LAVIISIVLVDDVGKAVTGDAGGVGQEDITTGVADGLGYN
jgi:hypothetical protein